MSRYGMAACLFAALALGMIVDSAHRLTRCTLDECASFCGATEVAGWWAPVPRAHDARVNGADGSWVLARVTYDEPSVCICKWWWQ